MSFELPLTIDLLFGETALSAHFASTRNKPDTPQWLLRIRMLSEVFILRPLPWNAREDYNTICISNQEYLKSALNFLSALPELKQLPILDIGSGDSLASMFLKRRGFKGVVTSDFENADSMYVTKWNNEQNGLYHHHIPFNWGQKFPKQELMGLWKQLIEVEQADPLDYSPFIPMLSKVCVILGKS